MMDKKRKWRSKVECLECGKIFNLEQRNAHNATHHSEMLAANKQVRYKTVGAPENPFAQAALISAKIPKVSIASTSELESETTQLSSSASTSKDETDQSNIVDDEHEQSSTAETISDVPEAASDIGLLIEAETTAESVSSMRKILGVIKFQDMAELLIYFWITIYFAGFD